jgi:hypothetical protein
MLILIFFVFSIIEGTCWMENPKFVQVTSSWIDYWYAISFEQCKAECLAMNVTGKVCTVILWQPDNNNLCITYGDDFKVRSTYEYPTDVAKLSSIKQCMSECRHGRAQIVETEFVK